MIYNGYENGTLRAYSHLFTNTDPENFTSRWTVERGERVQRDPMAEVTTWLAMNYYDYSWLLWLNLLSLALRISFFCLHFIWLVVGEKPLWKIYDFVNQGMMKFPRFLWENEKNGNQTTNLLFMISARYIVLLWLLLMISAIIMIITAMTIAY